MQSAAQGSQAFAPPARGPTAEAARAPGRQGGPSPALRRLLRELRAAESEPSWGVAAAPASDDDLFIWHCNVAGQPKGGGPPVVLHLELTFPEDYPSRPPKVEVLGSAVRHPNIFSTFICLDMLEGGEWAADEEKRRPYCGWSSAYSVLAILRQLQTFFFEGDGTEWWACGVCTLYNPMKLKRCDACGTARPAGGEIQIQVQHHPGFVCRCGHTHDRQPWPRFPDPLDCDDAPVAPSPDCSPDDVCAICLGNLDDVAHEGSLRGSPCARPLARLVDEEGQAVCSHRFHLPCAKELLAHACPLCRTGFSSVAERPADDAPARRPPQGAAPAPAGGGGGGGPARPALPDAARARMARLAEWPLGVVVQVMAFIRRPERAALSSAVPAWREAAQAPLFWEAQELHCFHEKTGPEEDVIGIGVNSEGRGKLSKLTAHFDAVSLTAWRDGLRRAAWKEPMTHWLPLFINKEHSKLAAPLLEECVGLLAQCVPTGEDSHLPPPLFSSLAAAGAPPVAVSAVEVLPEMMHQLLKQVLDGDRHASLKLLKGYFVLHRLFLHVCDQWPAIREAADAALRAFASSDEQRTKNATPWLAYVLQLLTVSNVSWEEIRAPFVEEVLARSVQFTRASYPHYNPVDPDVVDADPAVPADKGLFKEWQLREVDHGSEKNPGTTGATELVPGTWSGRPRGWTTLVAAPRRPGGRHAFQVRVRRLPPDAVLRLGWAAAEDAGPAGGWTYYSSGGCFGTGCGWKACCQASDKEEVTGRPWQPYGQGFQEDDVLTACVDRGIISFRRNGTDLGTAFWAPQDVAFRPLVALRRGAEVELLAGQADVSDAFATPAQLREMAWSARLNRRGNTLVLFQVFFLSLVRPTSKAGAGALDWESLKREYDARLGFPSTRMSAALVEHFAEVHRVVALPGAEAWPAFFRMLGFGPVSPLDIDRRLFAAYQRATRLGYKMGGRHDHA